MAIGPGYYEEEQRMLGIDYLDAKGRGERLREAFQVLDQGLRSEPASLAGNYWRIEGLVTMGDVGDQPPTRSCVNGSTGLAGSAMKWAATRRRFVAPTWSAGATTGPSNPSRR